MNPLSCKSLLSALVHSYEPILLNYGSKETGGKARQIKARLILTASLILAAC